MWESAPWPVVDNFRRAFLFGQSPPSTFCVAASRHGHKPTPGSGAASMIGCDARHTSRFCGSDIKRTQHIQSPPKPSGVFFIAHRSKMKKTDGGQFPERSRVGSFTHQHEQKT